MPFSATSSCTEEQWTEIFEELIKPAVELPELNLNCRRSDATVGNVVAKIIRDLNDAYVVVADLTDRNPNVFYELGVRHALKNRTILIAQDLATIPFDLRPYACIQYGWTTSREKTTFTNRLRSVLLEIDSAGGRPDNPVSDYEPPRVS
jgi:hypothetical protein